MVSAGGCAPIMTANYKVYTCLYETVKTSTLCENSLVINPQFSTSQQSVLGSSVQIITPPSNGTVVVNPTTGVITYTPNTGFLGTDTIIYKFCGNVQDFQDCELVTHTINVVEIPIVNNAVLRACAIENNPSNGIFDLTTAPVNSQPGIIKTYFTSYNEAVNNVNPVPAASVTAYTSAKDNYFCKSGISGRLF
ncbi:Ig-like domain-containing protein [Chryseobacterium indoltheticum]|uniref:Ig-like domain-containing protein n=1 Tax=Chryseobacterium indoltheticum TaxID=254 RepID=UPI003F493C6D